MTRPRKQTVDYFPHSCHHGKTIFVLEQRFGNDGYAFWFKLLEILGLSEGHYINCNDLASWEFLVAKTRIQPDTCTEILNILSNLQAIDPELWTEKIIWSGNFIDNIEDVYRKRTVETPKKPDNFHRKSPSKRITAPNSASYPQSKVKESKVKERKDISPPFSEKKIKKQKTPIPENFTVNPKVKEWAAKKGYGLLDEHLDAFKRKATMNGYVYLDWDSAFMEAVREDWAKLRQGQRPAEPIPKYHVKAAKVRTPENIHEYADPRCPDCEGTGLDLGKPCNCTGDKEG